MTTTVPVRLTTDEEPRCWKCNRLLAETVTRPWQIRCRRCKAVNRREHDHDDAAAASPN